jgi:Zn-dependent protease
VSDWQYYSTAGPRVVYARPVVRVPGRIHTSLREIANLTIAAVVLTADITILQLRTFAVNVNAALLLSIGFAATAALTGFVLHELAHKIAAQRRGYEAEFRMSPWGLAISFVTALLGWLIAIPGATVVEGMYDLEDWGHTSLAGPLVNLCFGGAFFASALGLYAFNVQPVLDGYLFLLTFFNGWFATFNLIPLGPLDGRKVFQWNAGVWALAFVVSAALTVAIFLFLLGVVSF